MRAATELFAVTARSMECTDISSTVRMQQKFKGKRLPAHINHALTAIKTIVKKVWSLQLHFAELGNYALCRQPPNVKYFRRLVARFNRVLAEARALHAVRSGL